MYDKKKHSQKFFQGHNDDVICVAQHPLDPDIIASGQVATIVNRRATPPHICIYNWKTGEQIVLKDAAKRAVRSVAFSADGKYLTSIGDDNNHEVTVWDWKNARRLVTEKADTNVVYMARWNHKDYNEFVTVGKRHVTFWSFDGKTLQKKKGLLGKFPIQTFTCIGFSEKGFACVGCEDGSVLVFVEGSAKKSFKVHTGPVYTVDWWPGGLVTGGHDGQVVVLDKTVAPMQKIAMNGGRVKSVTVSGNDLLVGTSKSEVYEIKDFASGKAVLPKPTVSGHWDGELWGLAIHPDGKHFVTSGEENMVAVWNMETRKQVRACRINDVAGKRLVGGSKASSTTSHPPNQCARSTDISPDGRLVAFGTNSGEVSIVDFDTLHLVTTVDLNKHGKRQVVEQKENWIQALKYSPDGKVLAVGTHGMVVCLLDAMDGYKVKGVLGAHNSAITHLDWSADGTRLKTNCRGYELLFHDVDQRDLSKSKQNKSPKELRDVKWASDTCILGWAVKGVFDPTMDGTDVNTVDVNKARTLIATGDDFGYVNLYRYPANADGNDKTRRPGHCAHVMLVRFTNDDQRLLTVGGNDKTICQWRIAK
jgi:microtubule-associated protein-like 6